MFHKETEYAMRGLVYIQQQNFLGKRPGFSEIAEAVGAPRFFIAKILQQLVKQGVLQSQKGRGGGFFFDTEKPELKLRDLISITEGNKTFIGCGFGFKQCNEGNPCPLHFKYAPIRDALEGMLSIETIQSLARKMVAEKSVSAL